MSSMILIICIDTIDDFNDVDDIDGMGIYDIDAIGNVLSSISPNVKITIDCCCHQIK